jgi:hypothetical protein
MRRRIMYASALLVAAGLAMPTVGAAQSAGWWSWALRDLAGGDVSADVVRSATRERNGGLLDVILDRAERERRDGRYEDRDGRYEDRDGRYEYPRDRRDEREARGRRGPKFCQNGQGHPVHGRQWCRDKGFGRYDTRVDRRWEDGGWEDVIFGSPRRTDRRTRTMDRGGLIDVLGDVVVGRLDRHRSRVGGRQPLEGRWLDLRDGGRVLQIRSGSLPVAELTDLNGDRRADIVLLPRR